MITSRPLFTPSLTKAFIRGKNRLHALRPRFRDWRFWVIINLITVVVLGHVLAELGGWLPEVGMLNLLPVSLFLVPVVFAALNFGLGGAVATVVICILAILPDWIINHEGLERVGVLFQMVVVVAVAIIVGQRVERERTSQDRATAATAALRASNIKYQSLLESSPTAILILDAAGDIMEANTAASLLFARENAVLESMSVAELIGVDGARGLLDASRQGRLHPDPLVVDVEGGLELYLEPTLTEVSDGRGDTIVQVVFRDATEEHNRQAGLRAYAAHMIRAQEDERQRIARELHDDTIQVLVLLCRQLDSAATDHSVPAALVAPLREARATAEEIVRRLRDFARALRPPILDDLGLVPSIRRLVTDLAERNEIEGRVKVVGEARRLPSNAELGMYRITQEALWNVEHHAEANRVHVTLTFAEHVTRLRVVDDGIGFSMPSVSDDLAASGQLGLISMQERAGILGGKIKIRSSPGNGTTVDASIPFAGKVAELPAHGSTS